MVVIIVHGGAGNAKKESYESKIDGVIEAAKKGYALLKNNQSAVDSVVAAAVCMEDNPIFNAAFGSSLTIDGTVENDAFIMEGKQMQVGAVASVKKFKNPIKVAKLIMEQSDHCILSGEGAHQFGEKNGIKLIDNKELVHQNALNRLAMCKTFKETINTAMKNESPNILHKDVENHRFENQLLMENKLNKIAKLADHDTVGAVAMDHLGNLACSTTTGGLTAKALGRIGDSPLAGSGGYAQNDVVGLSTTGHGENILRVVLAKHIAMQLEQLYEKNSKEQNKLSDKDVLNQGIDSGLDFMMKRVNGYGGVIGIDKNGEWSARFTTHNMPWAAIDGENLYYGIIPGQIEVQKLTE